jgi:hypothetical protein
VRTSKDYVDIIYVDLCNTKHQAKKLSVSHLNNKNPYKKLQMRLKMRADYLGLKISQAFERVKRSFTTPVKRGKFIKKRKES